jgi:hypothetical protein
VPIHQWPIFPISALREKFNPLNINHLPAIKFFARLDLDPICQYLDGHQLKSEIFYIAGDLCTAVFNLMD